MTHDMNSKKSWGTLLMVMLMGAAAAYVLSDEKRRHTVAEKMKEVKSMAEDKLPINNQDDLAEKSKKALEDEVKSLRKQIDQIKKSIG